jgi:hypothetical protein
MVGVEGIVVADVRGRIFGEFASGGDSVGSGGCGRRALSSTSAIRRMDRQRATISPLPGVASHTAQPTPHPARSG